MKYTAATLETLVVAMIKSSSPHRAREAAREIITLVEDNCRAEV